MDIAAKEIIENRLNVSNNGIITTSQISKVGLHRGVLCEFVNNNTLYRFSRGIYVLSSALEDELYLLQL